MPSLEVSMARAGLIREAHRIEEDCTFSSKSHFEAERFWTSAHHWIGIPGALIAGTAGVSAFNEASVIAGALAIIAGALGGLATFLNPSARAADHHAVGTQYLTVRNKTRFLREALSEGDDDNAFSDQLGALAERRNELNESAPPVPRRAFLAARKGIAEGEARHQVEDKPDP